MDVLGRAKMSDGTVPFRGPEALRKRKRSFGPFAPVVKQDVPTRQYRPVACGASSLHAEQAARSQGKRPALKFFPAPSILYRRDRTPSGCTISERGPHV